MKILTILGTRPEIIRLSRVIPRLDAAVSHTLVHTGQNHDPSLSDRFFDQLQVRRPDVYFGVDTNSAGRQVGQILEHTESLITEIRPDRLLLLGDTNSALSAIMAKRLGIPVFHMEAGNRCFDDRVPEEVNRRIIDHCTDIHMPYTQRSRENLLREGLPGHRIFVTGNPILEVIDTAESGILASTVLDDLGVDADGYFLVTLHRAENVDTPTRLEAFIHAFETLSADFGRPVIISTHPRTRQRLNAQTDKGAKGDVRFMNPFGFFDFIKLERNAFCVLSDSGTVQEECALFGTPNVTLRDVTERPETLDCGSNYLGGADVERICQGVALVTREKTNWSPPAEYQVRNVSDAVLRIVTSYYPELDG